MARERVLIYGKPKPKDQIAAGMFDVAQWYFVARHLSLRFHSVLLPAVSLIA